MRTLTLLAVLCLFVSDITAQNTPPSSCESFICLGDYVTLEPNFLMPNSRVYFDTGVDDVDENGNPTEIDVYDDGKLTAGIQLIGAELGFHPRTEGNGKISIGISGGGGISTSSGSTSSASLLMVSYGAYIDFSDSFRIEGGKITGYSADEDLDDIKDTAWYVGISLKSKFGDKIKDALKEVTQ